MMKLPLEIQEAANGHARAQYPRESCGVVVKGVYFPCRNIAEDPEKDFVIDPVDQLKATKHGPIEMVIHSHPNGPWFPSQADMEAQMAMNVPWAIICVDEDRVGLTALWGDSLPIAPIVGRQFLHGVSDCYSLVRDIFRLGKDELAKQDIEWPYPPVTLPEVPRDDCWWELGQDLYVDYLAKVGFREIAMSEARPGDCFLKALKSKTINHAGVLAGNNLLIHHLPEHLSMRSPAGIWARAADMWVRYEGPLDA